MPAAMHRFTVIAQAYVGSQRITKTVEAWSDLHVLRLVSPELEDWGYYVAGVYEMQGDAAPAEAARLAEIVHGAHPAPKGSIFDDII